MLSSKDLLERTGISRATLNNYIAAGLVSRPDVLPPGPEDGGAPRLGYFPDDTVERLETIQRLKREGWSLGRIVEYFSRARGEAAPPVAAAPAATPPVESTPVVAAPITPHPPVSAPSRTPQLMAVAALAVGPHDADALWVSLSVHDYFEMSGELEAELRRLVRSRQGQATRLAPYRFTCHFLPRAGGDPLVAAIEVAMALRSSVADMSNRWNLRRNMDLNVVLNTALTAGEAWVSADVAGGFQVVGDVSADAQHLLSAGGAGALLASRDFIARLPSAVRGRVVHGVRPSDRPDEPVRLMTFTRLKSLGGTMRSVPRRIADMAVTEVIELRDTPPAEDRS